MGDGEDEAVARMFNFWIALITICFMIAIVFE